MAAIEIAPPRPRQNLSISQLRAAAGRTADAKQARWLLSPSKDGDCRLDGHARLAAAPAAGMQRQTLRGWATPPPKIPGGCARP